MKKTYKYSLILLLIVLATIPIPGFSLREQGDFNKNSNGGIIVSPLLNPVFNNEDFGDAPEGAAYGYPTSLINNGARHTIVPGIFLGIIVDQEPDGQPSVNADCDDNDCLFPSFGDDEDGVSLPTSASLGSIVNINVTASVSGYLDAWIDFNQMNGWDDAGEHIFNSIPLNGGGNALSFSVPANATLGQSYLRFRFRDFSGTISYDGLVSNGEVEDYTINIVEAEPTFDFGDAPENSAGYYPTILTSNGARHTVVPGIYLGNFVDTELNGQPGVSANCDDNDCVFPALGDDEDGVTMPAWISQGSTFNVTVLASADGFLDAWFDFNRNNSWSEADEHVFTSLALMSGVNVLSITIPITADTGLTYLRFRFRNFSSPISFDGLVDNGEVEDYAITITPVEPEFDFGDAPENAAGEYPTSLAFNGARHIFDPVIFLGSYVDPEPDGQPGINANCDDTDCLFPSYGDDEDGVNLPAILYPGASQFITVTASVEGYLDAWMDFNGNNSWADAGEHFISNAPMVTGLNTILLYVPFDAVIGQSYIRFRFRDYSSTISYDGLVQNGEVEDYSIIIGEASGDIFDFGDAPENTPGSYSTILANNGARHIIDPEIYLGNFVDAESDGQPGVGADCDDNDCYFPSLGDDEDGVVLPLWVVKGSSMNLTISASIDGYLDAWMDFNKNDSWADAGEHIFMSEPLLAGSNVLSITIPVAATSGLSYARFRFRDFSDPISFDGLVANGEVEDYSIQILETQPVFDFGDAPENALGNYPTSLAFNGARHTIVPGIFLGSFVDPEPDGQPGINADCDDIDCLFPSLGDDEDGIIIPGSVSKGSSVTIIVTASVDGYLDAWMDFNLNTSWTDAGEHIFTNTPLVAGTNTPLVFTVPANAATGQSYARFRFRDYNAPISFDGLVQNGEVEDYAVSIVLSQINIDIGVLLEGTILPTWVPGNPVIMGTALNSNMSLPLSQPYNVPAAIWQYTGAENVISIPSTDIVDWIVLELRETPGGAATATAATTVDKQAAFLLNDGSVVSIDGFSFPTVNHIVTQNLYIAIWHRNHLGIMSANPMSFDGVATYSYNFISSSGAAYGTNAQLQIASGYYGMIPGDALPEGQIDLLDKTNVWNIQVGNSGYLEADFNLNGQVENTDKNDHWTPNTGKGIQIP